MDFWTVLGLLCLTWVSIEFIRQLGHSIPVMELMLFIAGLQWILGPTIEYNAPGLHFKYYMYVPQHIYTSYVVPAYIVFSLVLLFMVRPYSKLTLPIESLTNYEKYGVVIFVIGVVFDLLSSSLPGTLGFFAFILSNFKYAGAIILYFSNNKNLRRIFYLAIVYLFFSSLRQALFHDLILWSLFFYMFWAIRFKPSKKTIVITFAIAAFSLTTLQTIKAVYRAQIWSGYSGNKLELFAGLMVDAVLLNGSNASELDGEENNARLNQGWIISAIMDEVPRRQNFLNGETIWEAVSAALLPRFLNPNKKEAGGRDNFIKFTGLQLGESTSMGISIIGEAYGNFKIIGGILFMGVWAFFLSKIWIFLLKKCLKTPLLLAFLPLIFLQVIKAETELVVVLNHLVKSSIVVFGFFWATQKFLKWNLQRE